MQGFGCISLPNTWIVFSCEIYKTHLRKIEWQMAEYLPIHLGGRLMGFFLLLRWVLFISSCGNVSLL